MERTFSRLVLIISVLLVSTLVIVPFLSVCGVFQVSEGREGVVVEAMRDTGELVLPLRHGSIVPSKPPLFHWIGLATEKVTGTYREFELRFPSALAAIALCLVTALFAAERGGRRAGYLAAAFMLTTWGFIRLAGDGRVDMVFTFFTVTALLHWGRHFLRGLESGAVVPGKWVVITTSVLCGIAALAKGPLAFVLVGLVALVAVVWERKWKGLRGIVTWHWFVGVLIPLPWYLAAAMQGQQSFVARQLIFENLSRFTGAEGISPKPPHYYLIAFWDHNAPWSVAFAIAALLWARDRFRRRANERTAEDHVLLFSAIWIAVMILFFSLSVGKRGAYLLPTIPATSIFLAVYLSGRWARCTEWWFADSRLRMRRGLVWLAMVAACLSAIVLASPFVVQLFGIKLDGTKANVVTGLATVILREWSRLFPVGLLCLLITAAAARLGGKRRSLDLIALAIFSYLQFLSLCVANAGLAIKGETHSYREFARQVNERVPRSAPLSFIKTRTEESFDGFFFYLDRNVPLTQPDAVPEAAGTYLARRSWVQKHQSELAGRITEKLVGGRLADEPGEEAVLFDLTARVVAAPPVVEPSAVEGEQAQPEAMPEDVADAVASPAPAIAPAEPDESVGGESPADESTVDEPIAAESPSADADPLESQDVNDAADDGSSITQPESSPAAASQP